MDNTGFTLTGKILHQYRLSHKADPSEIAKRGGPVRTTLAKISHNPNYQPRRRQARQKLASRIAGAIVKIAKENRLSAEELEVTEKIFGAMEADFAELQ